MLVSEGVIEGNGVKHRTHIHNELVTFVKRRWRSDCHDFLLT
jgi:hypothetical protein